MMNANTDPEARREISSLMDGELDPDRQQVLLTALHSHKGLRAAWSDYHLIGDALRLREASALQSDLAGRVMAGLRNEPVVLAPRKPAERGLMRYAAALAASLAGVGVVAWLAFQPGQPGPAPSPMAQKASPLPAVAALAPALPSSPSSPGAVVAADVANPATAGRMQEYLLAHQAYSPINRFDGGAGYIRTVSANR